MRPVALGKKKFLFAGSDSGGERAAAIYTIVRTAKRNGLNPETYLRDVLAKIAEGHTINSKRGPEALLFWLVAFMVRLAKLWGFEPTLWSTLMTTRRVACIGGLRF